LAIFAAISALSGAKVNRDRISRAASGISAAKYGLAPIYPRDSKIILDDGG
jgi:hypothetical protein